MKEAVEWSIGNEEKLKIQDGGGKKKGDCYPDETKELVSKRERVPSHSSLRPEEGKRFTAAVRKIQDYLEKRKEDNWSQPSKLKKPHLLHSSGQVSGDFGNSPLPVPIEESM